MVISAARYDRAAYSIQELLRLTREGAGSSAAPPGGKRRPKSSGSDGLSNGFLSGLPADIQSLVSRFNSTKYSMDATVQHREYPGYEYCVRRRCVQ